MAGKRGPKRKPDDQVSRKELVRRSYRDSNRDEYNEQQRKYLSGWRKKNVDKIREYQKKWRETHIEEARARDRKAWHLYYLRHKDDPVFKEKQRERNRTRRLKKHAAVKE